ncbi:NRDE family protein [Castellaniella sp.]|uniref:NRDE family protein n=1 Tax=Castellaniella sp. TaxID=1955812 RepID=UPI002AFE6529|nr:NRDE family protein [Castellaniella sp.]
MCIAYLALGHPEWPVRVAANRDEFHARSSVVAGPWPKHPQVLAGRDLSAGGTWLGGGQGGRFALLTNFREPGFSVPAHAPSRGMLVRDFLLGAATPQAYCRDIARHAQAWAGFNLIVGDLDDVWYFSNRDPAEAARCLAPGQYVLSNHLLDTPWPKSRRLRAALDALPALDWVRHPQRVFDALRDTTQATVDQLPDTGLDLQREQLVSSPFIIDPQYGTRCSTLLVARADGQLWLDEQSYDPAGRAVGRHGGCLPGHGQQP